MRAILIDPFKKEVTEIDADIDGKNYQNIYRLIDCKTFDLVPLRKVIKDHPADMFIDDEGLLKSRDRQAYFRIGCSHQLGGKALVVGHAPGGRTEGLPNDITKQEILKHLQFVEAPSDEELEDLTTFRVVTFDGKDGKEAFMEAFTAATAEAPEITVERALERLGYKDGKEDLDILGPSSYITGIRLRDIIEIIAERQEIREMFLASPDNEKHQLVYRAIETVKWLLTNNWRELVENSILAEKVAIENRK